MTLAEKVTYVGHLDSSLFLDGPKVFTQFDSRINVRAADDPPVEYVSHLTGYMDIKKEIPEDGLFNLDSKINVTTSIFNQDVLDGDIDFPPLYKTIDVTGNITDLLNKKNQYDLYGALKYEKAWGNYEFLSSISVIYAYTHDIDGSAYILDQQAKKSIISTMYVPDFDLPDPPEIDGKVNLPKRELENDLKSGFVGAISFESVTYDDPKTVVNGSVWIPKLRHLTDMPSKVKVPWYEMIYSLNSTMDVKYGLNYYINSSIDVSNDQIYDINGSTSLDISYYKNDNVLDGTLELPPYKYEDITGTLTLDKTITRHEMGGIIKVVPPHNVDLDSSMFVESDYVEQNTDIPSILRIGTESPFDVFSSVQVNAAGTKSHDVLSSIFVTNELAPSRIGIFVDPIWRYEPFVLKNVISTFLDRVYTKNQLTIIYGGSPRANWDIKQFANIYRVAPNKAIELPFDFMPGNPVLNRDQMIRFIAGLFKFDPDEENKRVDKIFLFSDNPYAHNASYLSPLLALSERYEIPLVIINSKGEFSGTDPTGYTVNMHGPHPHGPHPHHGPDHHWHHNPGSKHRNIFDDSEIV